MAVAAGAHKPAALLVADDGNLGPPLSYIILLVFLPSILFEILL